MGSQTAADPPGGRRGTPEKQTAGPVTADHKMLTLQALSSSPWWEFRPPKKYLAPPPLNSPQTPSQPLAPPPPPPPRDPALWDFQSRIMPGASDSPFPSPEQKKRKYPKRPPSLSMPALQRGACLGRGEAFGCPPVLGRCPSTVRPVFPMLVFQRSKQQNRTRTTSSTVLGTPPNCFLSWVLNWESPDYWDFHNLERYTKPYSDTSCLF